MTVTAPIVHFVMPAAAVAVVIAVLALAGAQAAIVAVALLALLAGIALGMVCPHGPAGR